MGIRELIWKSKKFGTSVAARGLTYWEGDAEKKIGPRLIFPNRESLIKEMSNSW